MKSAVLLGIGIMLIGYSALSRADLISEIASRLSRYHISAPAAAVAEAGLRRSIPGYLRSLDPYTEYLSPQQQYRQRQGAVSSFGIGADILAFNDYYIIIPYRDGAAYQAGLQTPSRLLAVFGQTVTALPRQAVAELFAATVEFTTRGFEPESESTVIPPPLPVRKIEPWFGPLA